MLKIKTSPLLAFLIIPLLLASTAAAETGQLPARLDIMQTELQRNFDTLKKEEAPPYYIGYSLDHVRKQYAYASFGALTSRNDTSEAYLTIDLRVGSYALDNTHEIRGDRYARYQRLFASSIKAPLDESPEALRLILWQGTDNAYKDAVETLSRIKTDKAVKVEAEDSSNDFSEAGPRVSLEEPLNVNVDLEKWTGKVRAYSEPFGKYPYILSAVAYFTSEVRNKYFVNTDGSRILSPVNYMHLLISASAKADDGMELPLYLSYFGYQESDLPEEKQVMADIATMIKTLDALRNAPLVDPYAGPAILSGKASGVFFHEILGHRLEGHRQKSEEESQTFKKKVNERILPDFISVIFDPTIRELNGFKLSGYYKFDDEGTKAERVVAIENGVLKNFLMGRSPIENFPKSNGHARCQPGLYPVARQSNLIVKSGKQLPEKELREELIKEVKRQGKPFGLLFAEIEGGFTMTGRDMPNALLSCHLSFIKSMSMGVPTNL